MAQKAFQGVDELGSMARRRGKPPRFILGGIGGSGSNRWKNSLPEFVNNQDSQKNKRNTLFLSLFLIGHRRADSLSQSVSRGERVLLLDFALSHQRSMRNQDSASTSAHLRA